VNVKISLRGNILTLKGDEPSINHAEAVLKSLYESLEKGQEMTSSKVDDHLYQGEEDDSEIKIRLRTAERTIVPRNKAQADFIRHLQTKELVFGLGPAGTGKTYMAVAMGVSLLMQGKVDRLILSRPAIEAGEKLGFLPGDLKEKVDPYLRPIYDALYEMFHETHVEKLMESGTIEVAPLAFMRGRTLAHSYIILDEAQNTTTMQMKMFLTRLGEGSRMVITGDSTQIDLPFQQKSGLIDAHERLRDIDSIAFMEFKDTDVVRHPLVGHIVRAYADTPA
jgi:phosphate starvation-inducible PhoH-like protein